MSSAHFNVQNYIGSGLKLSAIWAITHADLFHKKISRGVVYSKNSSSNFCAIAALTGV